MKGEKIFEKTIYEKIKRLRYFREKILLWLLKPPDYRKPASCSVKMGFYGGMSYDLDNLIKQILDLLVDADLINDDVSVCDIVATKHEISSYETEYFTIEIYKWTEAGA